MTKVEVETFLFVPFFWFPAARDFLEQTKGLSDFLAARLWTFGGTYFGGARLFGTGDRHGDVVHQNNVQDGTPTRNKHATHGLINFNHWGPKVRRAFWLAPPARRLSSDALSMPAFSFVFEGCIMLHVLHLRGGDRIVSKPLLGGGFKDFLFSPLLGEMIPFD